MVNPTYADVTDSNWLRFRNLVEGKTVEMLDLLPEDMERAAFKAVPIGRDKAASLQVIERRYLRALGFKCDRHTVSGYFPSNIMKDLFAPLKARLKDHVSFYPSTRSDVSRCYIPTEEEREYTARRREEQRKALAWQKSVLNRLSEAGYTGSKVNRDGTFIVRLTEEQVNKLLA